MRNLSHPEAILALTVIAVASGLSYLTWFQPALTQIRSDRQATRVLLFKLAASGPEQLRSAPSPIGLPLACKPSPPALSPHRPKQQVHVRATPRPSHELELDEGSDPISGLEQ